MTVDEQGRSKGFAFVEFEQEVSSIFLMQMVVDYVLSSLTPDIERCVERTQRE